MASNISLLKELGLIRGNGAINISLLRSESAAKKKVVSKEKIRLLDTVALVDDLPERKLRSGEVGTVVEILAPDVFEVEFSDDEGETYAEVALRADQIIALHNQGKKLILEKEPASTIPVTALLSEQSLGEDWNRPEEDEAWSNFRLPETPHRY